MPIYEYRCQDCHRKVSVFWRTFGEAANGIPQCPRCGGTDLQRRMSRVAVIRGGANMESDDFDLPGMDDVDENDPKSVARWMRQMGDAAGEDMGEEFDEVVGRLEAGQSPEDIEEAMPDLGDMGGALGDDLD